MNIDEKLNAIINYILAETDEEKEMSLLSLRKENIEKKNEKDVEEEIASILLELGMPENIKGHRYSIYAINIAVENPDIIDAITGELYPAVAEKFKTTEGRVERAIRHGIECAWDRCDCDVIQRYFGHTISPSTGKPKNSEFIARVANIVRRRIGNA